LCFSRHFFHRQDAKCAKVGEIAVALIGLRYVILLVAEKTALQFQRCVATQLFISVFVIMGCSQGNRRNPSASSGFESML
jgi:hypothetical protein